MRYNDTPLRQLSFRPVLWLTAFVFLCNPNLHAFDLLPDTVGYLLLMRAFGRVRLVDDGFAEVTRCFGRMAWLSVARLVALVATFFIPNQAEVPTTRLLIAFVVGILELIVIIPAMTHLFHGIAYLGSRTEGHAMFAPAATARVRRLERRLARIEQGTGGSEQRAVRTRKTLARLHAEGHYDVTDRAHVACVAFAVLKTALCILPELAGLADASYREGAILMNWYAYINGFRIVAMLLGVAIGIWWLTEMVRYCRGIEQDTGVWQSLLERCVAYEEAHPERHVARRLRGAWLWLVVGGVFCVNFTADGIGLLPGVLTPVCWLCALAVLKCYLPRVLMRVGTALLTLHGAAAVISYVLSTAFFLQHDIDAYDRSEQVQAAHRAVSAAVSAEALGLLLSLGVLAAAFIALVRRYTGGQGAATRLYSSERLLAQRRAQILRLLLPAAVLGVLCSAGHVVYILLLPRYDFVWLIDVLVAALFAVLGALRTRDALDELDTQKMLTAHKNDL